MPDSLVAVLAISTLLLLIAGIIAAVLTWRWRTLRRWESVAPKLGLELSADSSGLFRRQELHGRHRGHHVRVYTYNTGGSRRGPEWTVVRATLAEPLGIGLRLGKTTLLQKLGTPAKGETILTGDGSFDSTMTVCSEDRAAALELLDGSLRAALMELTTQEPGLQLDDKSATITTNGLEADMARLEARLGTVTAACALLQRRQRR